jgi:hypothetical protein
MSEFSKALKDLLDDTNLFNRTEWSYFLFGFNFKAKGIETIQNWIDDKDIPRPMNLTMIIINLSSTSVADFVTSGIQMAIKGNQPNLDLGCKELKAFGEMAKKRATDVSPFGKRMLPTVAEYMSRATFSEMSSKLAKMTHEQQEKFLMEQYPDWRVGALQP